MVYKRKKIEPSIDDILWYTSPQIYEIYMWWTNKTFYRNKSLWKIVTIYMPVFIKWELVRYKRVYIPKEELKKLLDD